MKIWILFSRGKNKIYSLAALVRKILLCHSIIKFISSRHSVISPIYKTVSLKMQVFVVFIYLWIYIYSWLKFQVIPIVSFPQALGWRVNYFSGLSNDLVPRVLTDLTSSVKRERGWLSILILSSLIINEKKTKTGNHYRNGGWKILITTKFCELLLLWISSRIIVIEKLYQTQHLAFYLISRRL